MKFIKFLPAALIGFALAPAMAADNTSFTPEQTKAIQTIVHDYLVNQPQVLIEASEALQKQEMAKAEQNAQSAIQTNATQLFADPMSPVAGNPNGSVTIVEFFDYQCPHCKDMTAIIEQLISSDKNVRVVFKELPIFGANSRFASTAALAVSKINPKAYLKFHNALMAASNPLNQDKVLKIAKDSGIDVNALKKAMDDKAINDQIEENFKLAQKMGIMGTPSFVIAKWNVGKTDNQLNSDNTSFIPGATTLDKLKETIGKLK